MKNPKFLLIVLSLFLPLAAFAKAPSRYELSTASPEQVNEYAVDGANHVLARLVSIGKPSTRTTASHCDVLDAAQKQGQVGSVTQSKSAEARALNLY